MAVREGTKDPPMCPLCDVTEGQMTPPEAFVLGAALGHESAREILCEKHAVIFAQHCIRMLQRIFAVRRARKAG